MTAYIDGFQIGEQPNFRNRVEALARVSKWCQEEYFAWAFRNGATISTFCGTGIWDRLGKKGREFNCRGELVGTIVQVRRKWVWYDSKVEFLS